MSKLVKLCIKYYHILIKRDGCKACENAGVREAHKHMTNTAENKKEALKMAEIYDDPSIEVLPSGNYFYFHYREICRICKGKGYGGKTYWRERDEYFR